MAEKMVGLVPVAKKHKFGREETYAIVITDTRSIFAQLTESMLKKAGEECQLKGKETGRDFMQRWADEVKVKACFSERYWNIPPDDVLKETPGNFAIDNADISAIKITSKDEHWVNNEEGQKPAEMNIESQKGKHSFHIDKYSDDTTGMLKKVFGDKVKAG